MTSTSGRDRDVPRTIPMGPGAPTVASGSPRPHEIRDISNEDDLIRFAVQAQLWRIDRTPEQVTDRRSLIKRATLTACLNGTDSFAQETLQQLDDIIVACAGMMSHVGGLAAFGARMREHTDHIGVSVGIPPGWVRDNMMNTESNDELHVLVQASTLLSTFIAANRVGLASGVIRDQNQQAIARVADRLILLAGGPPTPRHYEAHALLGGLAKYAFSIVLNRLIASIRSQPLGFRSWRPLTRLMMMARDGTDRPLFHELQNFIPALVTAANGELRERSINPGRSLDLEVLIAIPWGFVAGSDDDDDRVSLVLLERAQNLDATLRERGTAAMGYWYRVGSTPGKDRTHARKQIGELVRLLDEEVAAPGVGQGMAWVARTLEELLRHDVTVGNIGDWPTVEEDWYQAVMDARRSLDHVGLPDSIREATKNLFLHSLLQNAGVERRRAIDTLRTAGLVEKVAPRLSELLGDPRLKNEQWLRIRVLFVLGYMQASAFLDEQNMVEAVRTAFERVKHTDRPTRAEVGELQTALFAVGDIFGVTGVEDQGTRRRAGSVRDALQSTLTEITRSPQTRDPRLATAVRALAYLLTFTAQPGMDDLSRTLLQELSGHPDGVARRFSEWAFRTRFDNNGGVLPFLNGVGPTA